ncbi:MAG TPA: prepilin-type N-terminal cleavage/methylation domain-containing protein [Candidatus Saccharimonadales bacterium]|nr:prepilin-type N-terminal cleavage/methylation domain-containing protein [Candidatus Saccharimonadales bacterium]
MMGGKQKQPRSNSGYTVVEAMVVLAVSGVMFTIAALMINGKQEQAQFRNDIKTMTSNVQTVLNNVADGVNPVTNRTHLKCYIADSEKQQGQNTSCVYLGQALYFDTNHSFVTLSLTGSTDASNLAENGEQDSTTLETANVAALVSPGDEVSHSIGSLTIQLMCFTPAAITGSHPADDSIPTPQPATLPSRPDGFLAILNLNGEAGVGNNSGTINGVNLVAAQSPTTPLPTRDSSSDVSAPPFLRPVFGSQHAVPLKGIDMYVTDDTHFAKVSISDYGGLDTEVSYISSIPGSCP